MAFPNQIIFLDLVGAIMVDKGNNNKPYIYNLKNMIPGRGNISKDQIDPMNIGMDSSDWDAYAITGSTTDLHIEGSMTGKVLEVTDFLEGMRFFSQGFPDSRVTQVAEIKLEAYRSSLLRGRQQRMVASCMRFSWDFWDGNVYNNTDNMITMNYRLTLRLVRDPKGNINLD